MNRLGLYRIILMSTSHGIETKFLNGKVTPTLSYFWNQWVWLLTGNRVGFLRSGVWGIFGFGFSDANKTIHASSLQGLYVSSLRNGVDVHRLYGTGKYASSLKRPYL